jgi:hypothetical protein
VVLSEHLWRSRFGADPGIAGTSITLDQRAFTVVGIMPGGFRTPFFNQTEQVWIPLLQDPLFSGWVTRPPQEHWLPVVARLRTGITPDQARGELETISAGLASQSAAEKGWMISIKPLQQVIVGDVEQPLLLLLSAAGSYS